MKANMTSDEQLRLWVDGVSIHNTAAHGECCPDFSCCGGDIAPLDIRRKFAVANNSERMGFLGMFLSAMIAKQYPTKNVYIAGHDEGRA